VAGTDVSRVMQIDWKAYRPTQMPALIAAKGITQKQGASLTLIRPTIRGLISSITHAQRASQNQYLCVHL